MWDVTRIALVTLGGAWSTSTLCVGHGGPLPALLHSTTTCGLRTGCVWDSGFLDKTALHTRCFEASGQWRP